MIIIGVDFHPEFQQIGLGCTGGSPLPTPDYIRSCSFTAGMIERRNRSCAECRQPQQF
jgi:hypothetical protein